VKLELSDNGLDLLKQKEGFSSKAYRDSAGKWTIGYGHLIVRGDGIDVGDVIDDGEATALLHSDVQKAVDCVNNAVTSNINQNQFDALVLFTYNVGNYAFQHSTLLQLINAGDFEGASAQFLRWTKVHNASGMFVEVAGLKNRRLAEQALFDTPEDDGTRSA
jgi:lysozyme